MQEPAGDFPIESITKTFTLPWWMLPRTSLLSRLCGDVSHSVKKRRERKAAKRNFHVLKRATVLSFFLFFIFLVVLSLSSENVHTRSEHGVRPHLCTSGRAHSQQMMKDDG